MRKQYSLKKLFFKTLKNKFQYTILFTGFLIAFSITCNSTQTYPLCKTFEDIEKNKGKTCIIDCTFREFQPWKSGKGKGHKFWDWEIVLEDKTKPFGRGALWKDPHDPA